MSYNDLETSVQGGRPVLLLHLVQGTSEWRYTTANRVVTALGFNWTPTAVQLGAITQSGEMAKDTLSLKFPRGHEFASTFLSYTPDLLTSVTLYRGHLDDPDGQFVTYWKGRVSSFKASGESLNVECEPIFTSLRRPGLRARYQRTCRHALYGRGCRLNAEDWGSVSTLTAVDGANLTVPAAASLPAGYLVGGMIRTPDGVLRYLVGHNGDIVTLLRAVKQLPDQVGSAVTLYHGCDHTRSTCQGTFNNLDNYGGFSWIPTKNPFSGSSIV